MIRKSSSTPTCLFCKFVAAALSFTPVAATAQGSAKAVATQRTDLQRHDISVMGREMIQVRVDFPSGAYATNHRHPGEEIIYVLEGTLEYTMEGQTPITLTKGGVLFVPAGVIHSAINVGKTPASELATYIVEKGKPLVEKVGM
jgi:quercetin dioxygenase-like cupin family protein